MTDNIINFQDIKTNLEETWRILSSFAFEEVTALNIEQLSNNLIIISNTLEKTIDVIKMLKDEQAYGFIWKYVERKGKITNENN